VQKSIEVGLSLLKLFKIEFVTFFETLCIWHHVVRYTEMLEGQKIATFSVVLDGMSIMGASRHQTTHNTACVPNSLNICNTAQSQMVYFNWCHCTQNNRQAFTSFTTLHYRTTTTIGEGHNCQACSVLCHYLSYYFLFSNFCCMCVIAFALLLCITDTKLHPDRTLKMTVPVK